MTDFDKIAKYYDAFDEWERLDLPEGRLEFDCSMAILKEKLPEKAEILDLGGGPGRYTVALAEIGYTLHLADLSRTLLDQAEKRIREQNVPNVKSVRQVNAVDLSSYSDCSVDAVLLFGPLYHLTEDAQRYACVRGVYRVLKPGGLAFASFIPYLSGAVGVVDRMFIRPDQVHLETLRQVFSGGVFHNASESGFQEGYYPTSDSVTALFQSHGFSKVLPRSVRGWGSGREEQIYKLKEEDPEVYETVIELIHMSADDPAIIETCSHAIYIGPKE